VAYYSLKFVPKSIEYYEKAIGLNSNFALSWYNKAIAYASLKQKDEMIECLGKAIQLDKNYKTSVTEDVNFNEYYNDEDFKKLLI